MAKTVYKETKYKFRVAYKQKLKGVNKLSYTIKDKYFYTERAARGFAKSKLFSGYNVTIYKLK